MGNDMKVYLLTLAGVCLLGIILVVVDMKLRYKVEMAKIEKCVPSAEAEK